MAITITRALRFVDLIANPATGQLSHTGVWPTIGKWMSGLAPGVIRRMKGSMRSNALWLLRTTGSSARRGLNWVRVDVPVWPLWLTLFTRGNPVGQFLEFGLSFILRDFRVV